PPPAMTGQETPASRAVLFGVHAYDHFPDLDGVRNNVPALRAQLTDVAVGGLADEHCVGLPADSTPGTVLDAVQIAAEEARDLLLVYYAGHGHFHRDGESLLLSTKTSHTKSPHRSVPYAEIRAFLAEAKAAHKIVIIDSCFSGVALHMDGQDRPGAASAEFMAIDGACVLTSAAETQRSLCVPEGSVFTLELVKLLRDGLTGPLNDGRRGEGQPVLTVADVYEALRARLTGRKVEGWAVPQPRMATRDDGHRIPLARNRGFLGATPTQVPRPPRIPHTAFAPSRHFTGREEEIGELVRLAGSDPPVLCLVHGRGGQGKSELLRATADRIAHLFPAGCLEVDLRGWTPDEPPRDPYAVIEEQLRHIGYEPERIPTDPTARAEAWRLLLKSQRLLLLLDNARDTRQLRPLLPGADAQSVVMMSSRNELPDLTVDWRHALAPLPTTDCITVWHKMGVPEGTHHLGELADGIHGSPHALGPLATALRRGASPRSLLASVSGPTPFRLLPDLDAVERAAFTSAYDALDADLRSLVHHCAWHPGPDFGPDCIAAMTGRPEEEVDIQLTRIEQLLVRKNGRYTFHDLSLVYARDRAAKETSDEAARASRVRLYAYLRSNLTKSRSAARQSAEGIEGDDGPDSAPAHGWLEHHALELSTAARAALDDGWEQAPDWLRELGDGFRLAGWYAAAEETFTLLLANIGRTSTVSAHALEGLGEVHRVQGRYAEATAAHEEARGVYEELADKQGEANATRGLGDIHYAQGRYAEATGAHERALALYRELADKQGEANATSGLGNIHYAQDRYPQATAAHRKALALYQELGDRRGRANATKSLGDIHYVQGRYAEAAAAYEETLALCQDLGDRHGQANATSGLGDVHYAQGRYAEATAAYEEALTLYRELGDRRGRADTTKSLGDIHHAQNRYAKAAAAYKEALPVYRELGDRRGEANVLYGLAHVDLLSGRHSVALGRFRSARQLFVALDLTRLVGLCDRVLEELTG
ncbi:caspase, EACC1-associated type, partial [Streptomyces sp. NPDC054787]